VKKPAHIDDKELVELCLGHDGRAWTELFNRYSALVKKAVCKRLGKYGISAGAPEVEEICQSVFTSLWRDGKLATVRNRYDISYWLSIVAGNTAMEHMRRKYSPAAPKVLSLSDIGDEDKLNEILNFVSAASGRENEMREIAGRIGVAIRKLPPKENLAVKLHLLYGKRYHEISKIMRIPVNTVASHIRRAKEKLREELKDCR
jgi:RNA polymerase sigma-70 factor (ECF subfamily)